jgi:hypothetical protein
VTSNDKTGDQLVSSIRRTKAGVTKKAVAGKKKVSAASAKRPSRRNALREARSPKAGPEMSVDPYQARRRVWPD